MSRLVLLLGVAGLLAMGSACSSLATLHGARTLEPGQAQVGLGLSVQRGGNPVSYAGIPIPQAELQGRVGIAPDFDIGARVYLLGIGFDGRYRFFHRDRLHVAISPGLAAIWLPFGGLAGQGSVEVQAPLTAEYELGKLLSVSGGPRITLRDQWNSVDGPEIGRGSAGRLDAFVGGGARLELHTRQLVLGVAGDLYAQPARHGGLSYSVGLDIGLRTLERRRP